MFQSDLVDEIDDLNEDLQNVYAKIHKINQKENPIQAKSRSNGMPKTGGMVKNVEKIYKNINFDSVKLDKLVLNLNDIFYRTKSNIYSLKNYCYE